MPIWLSASIGSAASFLDFKMSDCEDPFQEDIWQGVRMTRCGSVCCVVMMGFGQWVGQVGCGLGLWVGWGAGELGGCFLVFCVASVFREFVHSSEVRNFRNFQWLLGIRNRIVNRRRWQQQELIFTTVVLVAAPDTMDRLYVSCFFGMWISNF